MENTTAAFTGAEQQSMISWSPQRRIQCLFKIWRGRGRKWLAPVEIFERKRGSPGLKKMGFRWLVSAQPARIKAQDQAAGRHKLWPRFNTWRHLWQVTEIRIPKSAGDLSKHPPLTNEKTKARRGDFTRGHTRLCSCKLNQEAPHLRRTAVVMLTHTHTPLVIGRCDQHRLKSRILLSQHDLFSFSQHHFWFCDNLDASWPELAYSTLHKRWTN